MRPALRTSPAAREISCRMGENSKRSFISTNAVYLNKQTEAEELH